MAIIYNPSKCLYYTFIGIIEMLAAAQVELFHLLFLRQFHQVIDSKLYAVKGGCNLRFFFDSARYSEDLDIDIVKIQKNTLENKVNNILNAPSFIKLLQGVGIERITSTTPKQTLTTQRWKIQLSTVKSEMPLNTKIEFSRRKDKSTHELGDVSVKVCQQYRLPPMRLSHYGIGEGILQKILALANRSLTQARDVFDLYHLLHISPCEKIAITKITEEKAIEALLSVSFADYKSQVVSYLEQEYQKEYGEKDYWLLISNKVHDYIDGLIK